MIAPRREQQDVLGLRDAEHFRSRYLVPALELGILEMTLPEKPRSRNQQYRLTALGHQTAKNG